MRLLLAATVTAMLAGCSSAAPVASQPAAASVQAAAELKPVEIGQVSPDIAFTALDGSTHQLDEYKDRYVILVFFAQWCPICARELPSLQQFAKDPAPRDTVVVPVEAAGAAVDLVQAFQTRLTPGMPLFYDTSMKAANAFKVEHFPTTYLLTPDLVAREVLLGAVNPSYMGGRLKLYGGG